MGKKIDYDKIESLHSIIIENGLRTNVSNENLLLVCLMEILLMRDRVEELEKTVEKLNNYHEVTR